MLHQLDPSSLRLLRLRARAARRDRQVLLASKVPPELHVLLEDAELFAALAMELLGASEQLSVQYVVQVKKLIDGHRDFFDRVAAEVAAGSSDDVAHAFQSLALAIHFALERLGLVTEKPMTAEEASRLLQELMKPN